MKKYAKYSDINEGECKDCGEAMNKHFIRLADGPEICADQIICARDMPMPRWCVILFVVFSLTAAYFMAAEISLTTYREIMWDTDHSSLLHKWMRQNHETDLMLAQLLQANDNAMLKVMLGTAFAGWVVVFAGGIIMGIIEE